MKINENEIYESLRLSTLFSGHTFVTTPDKLSWNNKQDDLYFTAHPHQRFLLRISNSAEHDAPFIDAQLSSIPNYRILRPASPALKAVYDHIPPLWAVVSRLAPKRHSVTCVYRGSAFFETVAQNGRTLAKSDDDVTVAVLLAAMQMRRGIDPEEWTAFERRYDQALAAFTTSYNATRVH